MRFHGARGGRSRRPRVRTLQRRPLFARGRPMRARTSLLPLTRGEEEAQARRAPRVRSPPASGAQAAARRPLFLSVLLALVARPCTAEEITRSLPSAQGKSRQAWEVSADAHRPRKETAGSARARKPGSCSLPPRGSRRLAATRAGGEASPHTPTSTLWESSPLAPSPSSVAARAACRPARCEPRRRLRRRTQARRGRRGGHPSPPTPRSLASLRFRPGLLRLASRG